MRKIVAVVFLAILFLGLQTARLHAGPERSTVKSPDEANTWIERGHTLIREHKFEEGFRAYKKAMETDPDNPYAWRVYMSTLVSSDDREELLVTVTKFAERFPPDFHTLTTLANTYIRLEMYTEAIKAADRALALNPTIPFSWSFKAAILYQAGRLDDALFVLEKGLLLHPNDGRLMMTTGMYLGQEERYAEAVEAYSQALKYDLGMNKAYILSSLGEALVELERYEEALKIYDKAAEMKLGYTSDEVNRSFVLGKLGRHGEAVELLKKVIFIFPLERVAETYGKRARFLGIFYHERALETVTAALEEAPSDPRRLYLMGLYHLNREEFQKAINFFDRSFEPATEKENNNAEVWFLKGIALGSLGRHRDAIKSFAKALKIDPGLAAAEDSAPEGPNARRREIAPVLV